VWTIDNDPEGLIGMGLELEEELEEDIIDISLAVVPESNIFGDNKDLIDAI
jgi:hypothetical protein